MGDKHTGVAVIAEQIDGNIHPVSFELINEANKLADKLDESVYSIILGPEGMEVEELIYRGADKVYYCADSSFEQPIEMLYKENIVNLLENIKPEIILIGATTFGRSLAPRISAALRTGLTADCTGLKIDDDGKLIQIRPAFSENILAHIKSDTLPQMATIRYKEFEAATRDTNKKGEIINTKPIKTSYEQIDIIEKINEQEVNITEANIVVSGGKGLKNPEDFKILKELAELLDGEVGASRDVVDEGYIAKEHQVGYSGNRVKPKIYFACGISGAPQHLAGMKESDIIVAINTDPSAPIFEVADYGIVGDLYEVVPKLCKKIQNREA